MFVVFIVFFFFKQKTAYEMRISDWSSDVCSSDLRVDPLGQALAVVEPVDADHDRAVARAAGEAVVRTLRGRGSAQRHEFAMVDADRKGVRGGGAAADPNGAAVLVDLGVQFLAAIMEEAFEPFDRLEADHVIVEHRLDQSLVKGKRDEIGRT